MQCIRCGFKLQPNVLFCPNCAEPVATGTEPVMQPVEASLPESVYAGQAGVSPALPAHGEFTFAEFAPSGVRPAMPFAPGQVLLPPLPPNQPKKRSLGIIIFSVVFMAVLIGALVGAIAIFSVHINSTRQVQSTSNTADSAATQLYTRVINTNPALVDNLNLASGSQWRPDQQAQFQCGFQDGTFHVLVSNLNHFFFCPSAYKNMGNFAFQVQVTLIQGDYAGITFCANPSTGALYYLRFNRFQSYFVTLYKDDSGADATRLLTGSSSVINGGLGTINVITLIAQNGQYYIYFNRQFVDKFTNTFLTSGSLGLAAGNSGLTTEAAFSNARIWNLNS